MMMVPTLGNYRSLATTYLSFENFAEAIKSRSKARIAMFLLRYALVIAAFMGLSFLLFPKPVALFWLSVVATIRHQVAPRKFHEANALDPYELLSYYYDSIQFQQLSHDEKCSKYFSEIFPKSHWKFSTYDNDIFWLDALRDKYEVIRDRERNDCEQLGKTFCETWFKYEWDEKTQNNLDFETEILRSIPHYKIFNKCFLDEVRKEDELTDKTLQLSTNIEEQLFPWFTKNIIDYKNYETNAGFQDVFKKRTFNSYVKNMKHSFTGKGIAISASNNHFRLLSGLIALLRVQGNTLPIEIIYRDDLSIWNQEDLMEIATTDELLDSNEKLMKLFDEIIKDNSEDFKQVRQMVYNYKKFYDPDSGEKLSSKVVRFPKQDIRFVNAKSAIKDEYQDLFQAYSNKLIAFYFSSFKEVILMDSDTVPLINPEFFFSDEKYLSKKAFFFRDREIHENFPQQTTNFFKNLLPNKYDHEFFNLTMISEEHMVNNRFLNRSLNHLMESGIVVIDKFQHYNGVLLTMALQSWKPISQPIHGEKELYWLAQLVASDEDFEFNNNYAISLGKVTPKFKNVVEKEQADEDGNYGTQANELCSTHPGHISDDDKTLYWMNSGFEFCKKDNRFELDLPIDLNYYGFFDPDNLSKYEKMDDFYKDALRINAALIPPSTDYEYNNTKPWFEPKRSWVMTQKCEGYLWCAYDLIGGGEYKGDQYRGKVVNFDSNIERIYDFYGDLWMYYYNLLY
ncbi:hypothetical protein DASC09_061840 [Saccharomycopsis crataegensis]|uniref:Mannosyltransferase n=1 Tax=Saccharomycopsis crataegensis TaxID=43959 RepID=A0AAV5QV62_9ASCO|nr:hypothetical protein DASC09_061840 [Saccharomycopsis crataegensis]